MLFLRIFGGLIIFLSFFLIIAITLGAGFYSYYFARDKYETSSPGY
jgi:CHASE3 domain sensor protein